MNYLILLCGLLLVSCEGMWVEVRPWYGKQGGLGVNWAPGGDRLMDKSFDNYGVMVVLGKKLGPDRVINELEHWPRYPLTSASVGPVDRLDLRPTEEEKSEEKKPDASITVPIVGEVSASGDKETLTIMVLLGVLLLAVGGGVIWLVSKSRKGGKEED